MSELISRQAAIAVADYSDYVGLSVDDVKKVTDEVVKGLRRLPSAYPADVREVVHGEWTMKFGEFPNFCSVCDRQAREQTDYCPHCGAKMDERREDDNIGMD